MRARAPRDLAALPYAHRLERCIGEIEGEGAYEWLHFDGSAFEDAQGSSSHFSESAFSSAIFERGRYRRARFDGVWLHTVRVVGTNLAEIAWLDSECTASVFAGTEIHGSEMRRAVFPGSALDRVRFDKATLSRVDLREVTALGIASGPEGLTGATIGTTQLFDLAPALARHIGLTVKDD